ncbi:MAG: S-ribosylhomocysteine lyase [Lachnospiraceae bacterium]|nr:S-ribosylhomocysteine lyase [Lachnospiraceae bacterium]
MERIKSFEINHDVLVPGFYISRKDGDVITYDLRTRRPNKGDYMSDATMHSVEHMFATLARNSKYADQVIYFGPMGCQTGFYFLLRDTVSPMEAFELTKDILRKTIAHEGEVFGKSAIECGHYENLDINLAKEECKTYLAALEAQTNMEFTYPTK